MRLLRAEEVAGLLEVRVEVVLEWIAGGDLLTIDGDLYGPIPSSQLDDLSPGRILPGLKQLSRHFPGSTAELATWLIFPNDTLDGGTPATALRAGDVDAAVSAIRGSRRST